ncbi:MULTISPECIES: UbiA family prenyltransferase [unclassified Caballeronia]|uniref:UbiA family prenyltransferase n=1 Tax=unclassified Caballeronia TaxID=2646786 RepID=UPI00285B353B|nr:MULTISPECIES: UbiA family prenyltransferase [unclassified Caballeronia]MDR5737684.1 UbiA family prenyltransferase [Caballeronia sp. LZ016]MDR5809779.1 UbiA family prenyltransferase [Caballeronia sp. LZ019]
MSKPIVVDLDGTLIHSDILVESGLAFVRKFPQQFYKPLQWLSSGGKPALKARLAEHVSIDVSTLPYNAEVVRWLKEMRAAGRSIALATASHESFAHCIAEHLGIFDRVFATDEHTNLSSHRKRDRLVAEYGVRGFDYVGNSHDDIAVWEAADRAYVVNPHAGVVRAASRNNNVERTFEGSPPSLRVWAKALRLHQWLKNLLIFVPLLAGHHLDAPRLIALAVTGFLAFGLCASSVYLLNDLLDLQDDRHHPVKRKRPLAAGTLPLLLGATVCPVLLAASFTIALVFLPWRFVAVLVAYYVLTLAYSLFLKRRVMVDVVVLAALYTTRIIAGAAAAGVRLTFWLLAFSMFFFLSLALVKRYTELCLTAQSGREKTRGRGYLSSDLSVVSSLGTSSGYISVLVLALYIQDERTAALYRHPELIWLTCPLMLYWISRTWIIAHRGVMHDDPIVFAARDRTSLLIAALCGFVFWLAT